MKFSTLVFALDKTNNQRQVDRLRSMINSSDPADSVIVFTLVSEPPEDQVLEHEQAAECLDIAVAELHFSDLLSSKSNSAEVTVPVWDLDGEVLLGKLFLSVSGCRVLQALKV